MHGLPIAVLDWRAGLDKRESAETSQASNSPRRFSHISCGQALFIDEWKAVTTAWRSSASATLIQQHATRDALLTLPHFIRLAPSTSRPPADTARRMRSFGEAQQCRAAKRRCAGGYQPAALKAASDGEDVCSVPYLASTAGSAPSLHTNTPPLDARAHPRAAIPARRFG